jgi:hypothetical protein
MALGWCALAGGVRAQVVSGYFPEGVPGYGDAPGVTVQSRLHPDYDPPGVRLGGFVLHPQADTGIGYDSNPLGASGGHGSLGLHDAASALLASDWSRDGIAGYVSADNDRYPSLPAQNQTNWTAALGGTMAIGRDALTLGASQLSLHQSRTDIAALPTDAPLPYTVRDVRASYALGLDRLTLTPSADLAAFRYGSATIQGLPESQTYRDRDVLTAGLAAQYELAPLRNVVAVFRGIDSRYTTPQAGAPSQASTGWVMLAGLDYDDDAVWRFRLLAGGEIRQFAAPQYRTHTAPVAEGSAMWMPSGLTTLTATLTRSIEDPDQEGQAGYTLTALRLAVDHEYLRNLLLQGAVQGQSAVGLQGGGTQNAVTAIAGTTWLINRALRLSATYSFTGQHGPPTQTVAGQIGTSFTRQQVILALRFAL